MVLVHEGGFQTGTLSDINGCEGALAGLGHRQHRRAASTMRSTWWSARHTHAAYNCKLPNAIGRAIPVTSASAFGRMLTDIDLTIDPATRDVTAATAPTAWLCATTAVAAVQPSAAKSSTATRRLVSPLSPTP